MRSCRFQGPNSMTRTLYIALCALHETSPSITVYLTLFPLGYPPPHLLLAPPCSSLCLGNFNIYSFRASKLSH